MAPHPFSFGTWADVRVVAFVRAWSLEGESRATVQAIRERVRTLDLELTILCDAGVWSMRPDVDAVTFGDYADRQVGDVVTAAMRRAAGDRGVAVFVVGAARVARVGEHAATLLDALDEAAALVVRDRLMAAANPDARRDASPNAVPNSVPDSIPSAIPSSIRGVHAWRPGALPARRSIS